MKLSFIFCVFILEHMLIMSMQLQLQVNSEFFSAAKMKLERTINSMRLGNYLRMLMMRNNDLIDDDLYFLDDIDFKLQHEDLNSSKLHLTEEEYHTDLKARIFAFKFGRKTSPKDHMKPYSVTDESRKLRARGWKNFVVMLIGATGENFLVRVCFPKNLQDNFAIVSDFNKDCNDKIDKINGYKILDDYRPVKFVPQLEMKKNMIQGGKDNYNKKEKEKLIEEVLNSYKSKKAKHNVHNTKLRLKKKENNDKNDSKNNSNFKTQTHPLKSKITTAITNNPQNKNSDHFEDIMDLNLESDNNNLSDK
jgi:hypothetical protein